jgi:phosphoinositide-3-kinase regulatory subunit 4
MIRIVYIDQEEFVVERVLAALRSLVELGLLDRMRVREFVMATTPILFHPNRWLRNNVIQFLDSVGRLLNPHELFYLIYPLLKAFLLCEISELTSDKLMRFTKPPVCPQLTVAF